MKTLAAIAFGFTLLPIGAQNITINLDKVAAKAKEKTEVTLEGPLLEQALKSVPETIKASVNRVLIREYEFEEEGQYSEADIEAIRKQVAPGTGWSRVLSSKGDGELTEIYMLTQGGKTAGFLLISAEKKELTVINIGGSINLASMQEVVNSTIHYDLKSAGGQ